MTFNPNTSKWTLDSKQGSSCKNADHIFKDTKNMFKRGVIYRKTCKIDRY